jgi:uncharacterized protein with NRDE domain
VTNRRDGELAWADQVRSRGLLAVSLIGFSDPEPAMQYARDELAQGGFGGCNYLIANRAAAYVLHAPGARRIATRELAPGLYAMTSLDLDDGNDPRIRFVHENLEPDRFVASARGICRDDRIVIDGEVRGTVSSSLVLIGGALQFYHILGDPRNGEYEQFRPFWR